MGAFSARWVSSWDVTPNTVAKLGLSGLHGPNASGRDGDTWIYGGDVKLRWRAPNNFRGWPFVAWQSEVIARVIA